jgi:hypothetical protein
MLSVFFEQCYLGELAFIFCTCQLSGKQTERKGARHIDEIWTSTYIRFYLITHRLVGILEETHCHPKINAGKPSRKLMLRKQ